MQDIEIKHAFKLGFWFSLGVMLTMLIHLIVFFLMLLLFPIKNLHWPWT